MKTQLRISTLADEGPMQASKWLQHPMLISSEEMRSLFEALGDFYIFSAGSVVAVGQGETTKEEFLSCYREYINSLEHGDMPDDSKYRPLFSSIFTMTTDVLYAILVEGNKQLIRTTKPVIQLQLHRMDYSLADGKFRSMTFGSDSISWGILFSYPQLFQDNRSKEVYQVGISQDFPNTELFRRLQLWTRENTIPTPFLVMDKKISIPMRIGKECLPWINRHPQLIKKGLQVFTKGPS